MVVTATIHDTVDASDAIHLREGQLAQGAAELAAEFPDVPYEVVVGLLRRAIVRYETATVRSFLPILVAKDVRAELRGGAYRPEVPAQASPGRVR